MQIGIDLGGTKIELVALDAGVERFRTRVPVPRDDYPLLVETLARLVIEAERSLGARASVGLGTPGAVSRASGVFKNAPNSCFQGRALHVDLARRLGREIRVQNDANCFALSEALDGAAEGAEVVFGVIVGTGTGGGIVVRRTLLTGPNAVAGEWGHNPLPWPTDAERPGPACGCGKRGCVEAFLSGPGLERDHAERSGCTLAGAEIEAAARAGDAAARESLHVYCDRMARALATVINLLDPDVIVLGGGVSKIASLYTEVPRLWGRYVFSDRVDTRLAAAKHGDASGVRGAARLWG